MLELGRQMASKSLFAKGMRFSLAKSDGGNPRRLLPAGGTAGDIRWSPDGSILRFTVNDPKTNNRAIWQASVDGSQSSSFAARME